MRVVLLEQTKPQQAYISGIVLLVLTPILWYYNENSLDKILVLLLIGIIVVGYSITYEIKEGFENYKRINIFGITIWKQKLHILFPDYISIFSASFKKGNEWGAVSALGTKSKYGGVAIKFFKGHKNEIVYKSNDYSKALKKANELSFLLKVRLHDAIKNSST